jgi:hypothetical protein
MKSGIAGRQRRNGALVEFVPRAVLAILNQRDGRPRSDSLNLLFNVPGNGDGQNVPVMQKATSILLC